LIRLFIQPGEFFRAMPGGAQVLVAALLVLAIIGYTATQVQSSASTNTTTTTQATGSFDLSLLDADATQSDTTATAQQTPTATTTTTSSDTTLMNALLAASGMLILWAGQAALLCTICMFRGYAPKLVRSFQIAVWASLPLALMLVLRYVHYSTGGEGGSLGLSLLLDNWSGYSTLTEYGQRIAGTFLSSFTLFWLWNLALLYLGARYALGGRRFMVFVIIVLWVVASTLIPALVTEPETRTAPRPTASAVNTTQTNTQNDTSTTQTQQNFSGANGTFPGGDENFPGGGNFTPPDGGSFNGGGRGNG
jgi:hypothetical protein